MAYKISPKGIDNSIEVIYHLVNTNKGTTYDVYNDKEYKGGGYAVSLPGREHVIHYQDWKYQGQRLIKEYIAKHIDDILKEGQYLGVWANDGDIYLDITRIIKRLPEALQAGIDAEQLAIFDMGTLTEISIKEVREALK